MGAAAQLFGPMPFFLTSSGALLCLEVLSRPFFLCLGDTRDVEDHA